MPANSDSCTVPPYGGAHQLCGAGPDTSRVGGAGAPGSAIQPSSRSSAEAPPASDGGLFAGAGPLDSGRAVLPCVALSMKFRQRAAGRVPPVTWFIGVLSSLPSQTPATRSDV